VRIKNITDLNINVAKSFSASSLLKVCNMLLVLLSGILLARLLGPKDYGSYSFIFSIIVLLGIPIYGGLPTLIVREVASYTERSSWKYFKGLLKVSVGFSLIYCIIIYILSVAVIFFLLKDISFPIEIFLLAFILLPIESLSNIRAATLRGLKKFVLGDSPEQLIRPLFFACVLTFFYFNSLNLNLKTAVLINIFGAMVALFVGFFFVRKNLPFGFVKSTTSYEKKEWFLSFIPFALHSGLIIAGNEIATVFLGVFSTPEDVAIFKIAYQGAVLIAFGITALDTVLGPYIIKLYKDEKLKELQKLLTLSARIVFFMTLPLFVSYIVWGKHIILFLFGEDYIEAYNALVILSLGRLFHVASGSVGLVLQMLNYEVETARSAALAIVVNIFLCLFLIPFFGVEGAAIASSMSIVIWNLYLMIRLHFRLKIYSNAFVF
jgi:O-antigen/teichoic acid export membrane protein